MAMLGTGKTHLATAIGVEACKKGYNVKFFRTSALVNRLVEARKGGELSGFLKQLSKADLLMCDEWGYVPLDQEGAQLLFQVISDCYEQKSIIITTNLEFS
jgi:DNA replication protein DnaC